MARSLVTEDRAWREASYIMLHVGLDLSRKRVDVCLISDQGELVDELAAPFDEDGLGRLSERVAAKHTGRVRAVVESMNGARFIHDTLPRLGRARRRRAAREGTRAVGVQDRQDRRARTGRAVVS